MSRAVEGRPVAVDLARAILVDLARHPRFDERAAADDHPAAGGGR